MELRTIIGRETLPETTGYRWGRGYWVQVGLEYWMDWDGVLMDWDGVLMGWGTVYGWDWVTGYWILGWWYWR